MSIQPIIKTYQVRVMVWVTPAISIPSDYFGAWLLKCLE